MRPAPSDTYDLRSGPAPRDAGRTPLARKTFHLAALACKGSRQSVVLQRICAWKTTAGEEAGQGRGGEWKRGRRLGDSVAGKELSEGGGERGAVRGEGRGGEGGEERRWGAWHYHAVLPPCACVTVVLAPDALQSGRQQTKQRRRRWTCDCLCGPCRSRRRPRDMGQAARVSSCRGGGQLL